jgi:Putative esterase
MKRVLLSIFPALFSLSFGSVTAFAQTPARFEITYASNVLAGPITGRLFVVIAKKGEPEPRLAVSPQGPAIFGMDVEHWKAGEPIVLDAKDSLGYPKGLEDLPPGDYFVQAIVNVYTEVHRGDNHTVAVHFDDSDQVEIFNTSPGNAYSDVQAAKIGGSDALKLSLSHVIAEHPQESDTEWVKHVRMQSRKVSAFWGRPMYIYATVLLPKGYAEHPNSHYPVVFTMGHNVPFSFSTEKASERQAAAAKANGLQTGYDFYQSWISDSFPRFIAVSFQQQTPYFPDSYSINSVNQGPYGDAMIEEVIPTLEKQFRMIPKAYARQLEGASTGGWQTLGLQLHHPDFFGGAWVLQPDPIDFRHYQLTNIYEDENAFSVPTGPFTSTERPFKRAVNGQVVWTARELSHFEEVLGNKGRSDFQLEGWEAIYGPIGADGYPVPLWDKLTGRINHDVANYMKEHGYDLLAYTERNWPTLGPKIVGKLHFFAGDMDDFYLNLAVYSFQDFLKSTKDPHYEADFTYGRPMKGHSWHSYTWAEYIGKMAEQVKQNAPSGEDTAQWNY